METGVVDDGPTLTIPPAREGRAALTEKEHRMFSWLTCWLGMHRPDASGHSPSILSDSGDYVYRCARCGTMFVGRAPR